MAGGSADSGTGADTASGCGTGLPGHASGQLAGSTIGGAKKDSIRCVSMLATADSEGRSWCLSATWIASVTKTRTAPELASAASRIRRCIIWRSAVSSPGSRVASRTVPTTGDKACLHGTRRGRFAVWRNCSNSCRHWAHSAKWTSTRAHSVRPSLPRYRAGSHSPTSRHVTVEAMERAGCVHAPTRLKSPSPFVRRARRCTSVVEPVAYP